MSTNSETRWSVIKYAIIIILVSIPDVISYYATVTKVIPLISVRISMASVFLLIFYSSTKALTKYKTFLLSWFMVMLLLSVFHITSTMPVMTILCISCLMLFGVLHKPIELVFLNKALAICALVFTPILIIKLFQTNIDIDTLLRRGYAWTEIFAYTTLTTFWLPFLFSSVLTKRNNLLALVFWLLSLIMSLISLKRQNVVESFLAFSIIIFIVAKTKERKMLKRFLFIMVPFVLVVAYTFFTGMLGDVTSDISGAMSERFSDTAGDIQGFDRFVESKDYFMRETDLIDVILGKGLLSAHYALPTEHYFLHVGWTNFVFKGGIVLFLGILLGYRRVFKVFFHPNDYSIDFVFCSMYCVYYFVALVFSNLMSFSINLLLYFYCLCKLNSDYNKNRSTNVV